MMFPKLKMMGDMKAISYGIIAMKSLWRYSIAKEATNTSMWLEFCSFIKRKRDKTITTKKPKERSS